MRPILGAGEREAHFPFGALDPVDPHRDTVAQPVGPAGASPDERGPKRVQLEVVPGEVTGRQIALEDTIEANEQARADRADDLPVEGRVPAGIEQATLEQPGETELIGEVLDARSLTFAHGGPLT